MTRRLLLLAGGLVLLCALGAAAALRLRGEETARKPHRSAAPAPPPLGDFRHLALRVPSGRTVVLRNRPGGRTVGRLASRTAFGSPQTLAVAGESGARWLAVRSPALGNDRVGWVDARGSGLRILSRPLLLDVDLSRRELAVRSRAGVERRIRVAVGAPDTPTPRGKFFVTDKLPGSRFGPYYGCCILALSGRQPNLPEGWSGGDRLAVHGSPTATWGQAVSNGCLHASERDLVYLMKTVPLGTQMLIHA